MNEQELQQAFIQFLAEKTGAKTQQDLEKVIQQLGEEGLKAAYAEFMQTMQQQVQAAKFGAKLNYIKELRGQCPEGYETEFFKKGGSVKKRCKKCEKILSTGGEVPTNAIDAFKCGKKMKKKENGGNIEETDTVHVKKKVFNLNPKKKLPFPLLTKKDYQKLSNEDKGRVDLKDQTAGRSVNTPNGK